jgi:cytoplasmic tRNA 2-thiolation protein 2
MTSQLCNQCSTNPSHLEVRKRHLCKPCFIAYVNSKVRKRMESYRFKNIGDQKKRLLLPLSGGVSSLCLLQILDAQLNEQMSKQNRTAYELLVVRVDDGEEDGQSEGECEGDEWWRGVEERFGLHTYLRTRRMFEVFEVDLGLEGDLGHLGLVRRGRDDGEFYEYIMASTKSVTTRSDLKDLMLKRMLLVIAKEQGCDSIIWGHSDSRLAAQALSDVAKGRGGAVPRDLADGMSSDGVVSNYVMRDLFKSELEAYAAILDPPLEFLKESAAEPVSIRSTSIDQLLNSYITSQGEKYPSIMANVVRTASKLQVPRREGDTPLCPVCQNELEIENKETICYGCERMRQDIKCQDG